MSVQGLGGFNPAQFQQRLFQQADADKSGGVSLEELTSVKAPPGAPQGVDAAEIFARLDGDGDGSLSQSELKAPPFGNPSGLSGEALSGLFASDAEGSDGISALLDLLSSSSEETSNSSSNSTSLVDLLKQIDEDSRSNFSQSKTGVSSDFRSSISNVYDTILGALSANNDTGARVFA